MAKPKLIKTCNKKGEKGFEAGLTAIGSRRYFVWDNSSTKVKFTNSLGRGKRLLKARCSEN